MHTNPSIWSFAYCTFAHIYLVAHGPVRRRISLTYPKQVPALVRQIPEHTGLGETVDFLNTLVLQRAELSSCAWHSMKRPSTIWQTVSEHLKPNSGAS